MKADEDHSEDTTENPPSTAATALRRLINGYQASQAIHVAAVLGVADHLSSTPKPCKEIAAAVGAKTEPLYRVLRALAALGVFAEGPKRSFTLTPMGACLRADSPTPLAPFAVFVGQEVQRRAWGHLLHAVETGESAFRTAHGMTTWQLRERQPEQNAMFNAAMTGNSRRVNAALIRACPIAGRTRIADIAGGHGSLLADVLVAHPESSGVLFDLPHVVDGARSLLCRAGVLDRCEIVGGDIFAAIPQDCDAYLLKYVLHDWDDDDALKILSVCRRDMPPAAHLFVFERWLGLPNADATGKLADLSILVGPGGRERTREELAELLEHSGFTIVGAMTTGTPLNLLIAEPA